MEKTRQIRTKREAVIKIRAAANHILGILFKAQHDCRDKLDDNDDLRYLFSHAVLPIWTALQVTSRMLNETRDQIPCQLEGLVREQPWGDFVFEHLARIDYAHLVDSTDSGSGDLGKDGF